MLKALFRRCKQHQIVPKSKRLILQLPTVTPPLTWLLLSIQVTDYLVFDYLYIMLLTSADGKRKRRPFCFAYASRCTKHYVVEHS